MTIDHICFAVKDIAEAISYWENIFGYTQLTKPVINKRQKVKVVFLEKEESLIIKLIEPTEDNSRLQEFVNQGGGFHHLCFKCDDLTSKIDELKSKGVRVLVPPEPGEAFNNNNIAFLWSKSRFNFELIDTDEKAQRIES